MKTKIDGWKIVNIVRVKKKSYMYVDLSQVISM